jgi:hypothetical protein
MGYAELIHLRLQTLPPDKQAEIYDFVEFIASRAVVVAANTGMPDDWSADEFSRFSMTQAMRGLENDPVVYSVDDLKERWQ